MHVNQQLELLTLMHYENQDSFSYLYYYIMHIITNKPHGLAVLAAKTSDFEPEPLPNIPQMQVIQRQESKQDIKAQGLDCIIIME